MKQNHTLVIIPALVLFAFLAGCLSHKTAGFSAEKGILVVEDRGFASNLDATQDQSTVINGGFLKVQVTLRNTGKRDFPCQYRFLWKDKDGMTLKAAETLWTPLMLHGREEAVLQGISPVPGAADYRLVLRPRKNR